MDQASALQALLARVTGASAGLEFGFGGGSRYRQLLEDLQADGDDSRQEAALRKLTEMLLMGNEETLAGFRPDQFVPALHNLLQSEYRPQVCAHLVPCIRLDFTRAHMCCWTLACSRRPHVRRTFCFRVLGWLLRCLPPPFHHWYAGPHVHCSLHTRAHAPSVSLSHAHVPQSPTTRLPCWRATRFATCSRPFRSLPHLSHSAHPHCALSFSRSSTSTSPSVPSTRSPSCLLSKELRYSRQGVSTLCLRSSTFSRLHSSGLRCRYCTHTSLFICNVQRPPLPLALPCFSCPYRAHARAQRFNHVRVDARAQCSQRATYLPPSPPPPPLAHTHTHLFRRRSRCATTLHPRRLSSCAT
jgi:hypothetical protein